MKKYVNAFRGLFNAVKSERNMRIHLAFAFYVLLAAAVADASRLEWCAILICIGAVISAELLNTAIERMCDALHPGRSEMIGAAKDIAAGAVLVLAVASAIVGGIIFFNAKKIETALYFAKHNIPLAAMIVASAPAAAYLVYRSYEV